jgi:hypothetical protein
MITVDGQPVGLDGDELSHIRIQLKLCKALAALNPPHKLAVTIHARIASLLRALAWHESRDRDTRQPADLTDQELHEAAGIVRALRVALPPTMTGYVREGSMRAELGGYALGIADEIQRRSSAGPQDHSCSSEDG